MNLWLQGERMGERLVRNFETDIVHTAIFKMSNQQGLTI